MSASNTSEVTTSVDAIPALPEQDKFRYAVKTALSLTLAYLVPMAMGWPQPQTAATTVMLIAATGLLSDSLQKGVMRVLGTVAGAVIGLTLIALFPQERMTYLLAVSVAVACIFYLYNAYQADSTVFMLTAVVTLMVFSGGNVEDSFLYGVDRAFMTAFGVIVYTLVATFLWPVRSVDNSRVLAARTARSYAQSFDLLLHPQGTDVSERDEQVAALLSHEEAFQTHYASVKNSAAGVVDYSPEWNAVVSCYEELEARLLPALQQETKAAPEFDQYLTNYQSVVSNIQSLFQAIDSAWQGRREEQEYPPQPVEYVAQTLRDQPHLVVAAVAGRAELLESVQQVLLDLRAALDSLLFDRGDFSSERQPRGKPAFVWLDLENLKTAVRAFCIFWIAVAIWIQFNPPGGYTFVIMSTIFIPLVSYTPATPKLLMILMTFGFIFAIPAYIFLLPSMTHWAELAVFIFVYAFVGFYLFQGPVSIFFLLGLFILGIQNTMSYHFDAIMLICLMFYMVGAMQIVSTNFPFTSKPERIYCSVHRRFFIDAAGSIRSHSAAPGRINRLLYGGGVGRAALLAKLQVWGAKIDPVYFPDNDQPRVATLNRACSLLHGQLGILSRRRMEFSDNPLIAAVRGSVADNRLAQLCDALAQRDTQTTIEQLQSELGGLEARLDELLGDDYLQRYDRQQLAQFYVYLSMQTSIFNSLRACSDAQQAMNWQQLGDPRF